MTSTRHIRLSLGVVVACMLTAGFSAEPNQPEPTVRFRPSSPMRLRFEEPPSIKPMYAAQFEVNWGFAQPNEPNAADLLKTSAGRSFSARQRDLLDTDQTYWLEGRSSTRRIVAGSEIARHLSAGGSDSDRYVWGRTKYRVHAVSEADVERMVHALLEFLAGKGTDRARRNFERLKKIQPQLETIIAKAREKRGAKSSEVPVTNQKYTDAIRNSPYSKYPASLVPDEVRKTIFEMDKMLDVLNIEIVGIQSKLSAINKHSQAKDVLQSQTLTLTLREMAIRQEIELVGAESRRQATMSVKRREEALYNQYEAFRDLKGEIDALSANIKRASSLSARIASELNRLEPGEPLFKVERNDVIVHRLMLR